jgi:Lysophospholipase L1 and related esterases
MTTAVFLGDSITLGYNVTTPWALMLANRFWWTPVINAVGGTGYLAGPPTFRSRVPAVLAANPDIVIVAGGFNDVNFPVVDVGTECGLCLDALASVPTVIVLSPFNGVDRPAPYNSPGRVEPYTYAIRDQAYGRGRLFIDMQHSRPWLNENCNVYEQADGGHPNQAGHDYLASMLFDYIVGSRIAT